ncbi:MAG: hypothetical protein CO118_03895 [Flavobacteriales bacterium CG_4_9_14_3_um_filter_32_8]|nr:MAG: hypothetical protein CO118_03895 [Flavobacteriales bacterium CG_4_9_14_3_um_filter_32_8]
MKKTAQLFFLLLFINPFSGKAQTYYPFPTSNAFWKFQWGVSGCTPPFDFTEYDYQIMGDTLIGLNTYHKLKRAGIFYCGDPLGIGMDVNFVGAYRNDSLAKKIYYIPKDSINENLLYDFNLITGDTIKGYMEQLAKNKFGSTFYAVIDSIDSVLVDSNYRKRWHFQTYDSWGQIWYDGNIIEGVGNTYGLLEGLLPMFDDNGSLVCYSENGATIYPNPFTCTLTTINDFIIKNENIVVYPNPIVDYFTINSKENFEFEYTVFSVDGQLVKNGTGKSNSNIPIHLKQGIYILQINNEKRQIHHTKKLIKLYN